MKFKILGRPEFFFSLTKEQVELVSKLSSTHYDADARSLSKPGGFIYGWIFRLDENSQVEVSATWRQLDSLTKVFENTSGLIDAHKALIDKLSADIATILVATRNEICPRWEENVDTDVPENEYVISAFNTGGSGWEPIRQNGVKIIHIPSRLEASSSDARSLHRNKSIAWDELQAKVEKWKLIQK